ncbi:hypothetical protein L9F63_021646 [Diploptera punctata]|uniref:Uncharacterized protein n=1 Tax=Diploptera punctata TaxID=6984 RepID=A0AAD7ZP53_DIPPU|nr:hypothetical protein L9F63_021646 [Diploptera punctata]
MYSPLEKVGLLCLSVVGLQLARSIAVAFYNHILGPLTKNINLKDMGSWAVVTGATDGLGKAYAEALAKLGINIILISRDREKLQTVAAKLEEDYQISTKIIEADFTDNSSEAYGKIEKDLWSLEIGILINNVGISNPHPEYFLELPHRETVYSNIIKCNIGSVTSMTQILLPRMVERGRGVVVNVSSTAATIPSPLLTVYGASKAYIEKFSKDLATEYSKCGVIIQCILPGFVATKMSKIKRASWMAPTPEKFVKDAIRSIGVQQQTTGYLPHSLMVNVIHFIENISPTFMNWVIVRTMENIRRRALHKPETEICQ